MKEVKIIFYTGVAFLLLGCSGDKLEEKGFSVNSTAKRESDNKPDGITGDSLKLETRPSNVLLTGIPNYRLATIYKVNLNKKKKTTYIGSNHFHGNYNQTARTKGNNWNYNYMPGLEAVYGYNMVNISHYDLEANKQKTLFEKPVLIKTLYYPSFSNDTLNFEPVNRDYFMVSVYDDDTNKDNIINVKDLRRLYLFDIKGNKQRPLIPKDYSVFKSEYDPENDFMYVFAQLDENANGQRDEFEPIHIFWIDLKDPKTNGRLL